ncbi:hypothetical protein GCM10007047_01270 [Cerasicoccus arenae]|uniref:histidine kinase n=2 Tax=Cerasicoccus arenae TaxID=424488 RepID=A0A8J3DCR6_9BACT|nr:hypothetical protein GCM10007047_01270 [Cerasicoccus arenae]
MRWLQSFRARVALFSALLILLIVAGLALTLRFMMRELLTDSLDQQLAARAEGYMPIRDFLSADPYQISEARLPQMPPFDVPITFLVYGEDGELLLQRRLPLHINPALVWEEIQNESKADFSGFRYFDFSADSHVWRCAATQQNGIMFVWARRQYGVRIAMAKLDRAFLFLLPIALLTAGAGGWEIGRRTLRPVKALAQRMREIDADGLDRRLDEAGVTSEIRELIRNHNRMLDRLEKQFHQASRFSADAAHELNTPLTVMQSEVEAHLRSEDASSTDLRFCESMLEEIMRLKSMAQKLLLLAQYDTGQMPITRKKVDLSALIEDLWEDIPLINPELEFEAHIAPGVIVLGDFDLLRLLAQNLLVNAIRYNCRDGWMRVTLSFSGEQMELTIANTASPIPADQAARLFDRFYRADAARANSGGSGLGLSLAREIAEAHQADLALCRNDGDVVAFRLRMACQQILSTDSLGRKQ